MFMQGRGVYALKLASIGALMGSVFFLLSLPVLTALLPTIFESLSRIAWVGLLGISLHLILKDKSTKHALVIFVASGFLGLTVLENEIVKFPLLSLFSGLFGLGLLWDNSNIDVLPDQITTHGINLTKKGLFRTSLSGLASSLILGIVPSIGPTQASVLSYEEDDESFLVKMGVVNIADVFISLLTLFIAGKARSGALVELKNFGELGFNDLTLLFGIGFLSAVIAFMAINYFGPRIIKTVSKLDYKKLTVSCACFVILVNFVFNGYLGVVICFAGAIISKKAVETGIMKSHCMGVLILPTLVYYLF